MSWPCGAVALSLTVSVHVFNSFPDMASQRWATTGSSPGCPGEGGFVACRCFPSLENPMPLNVPMAFSSLTAACPVVTSQTDSWLDPPTASSLLSGENARLLPFQCDGMV